MESYKSFSIEITNEGKVCKFYFKKDATFSLETILELGNFFEFLIKSSGISLVLFNAPFPSWSVENEDNKRNEHYLKMQKLLYAIKFLPQLCICNWGVSSNSVAIDFGFCCDFRIISSGGSIKFSHLLENLSPCYFSIPILNYEIGVIRAKDFLFHFKELSAKDLLRLEFIYSSYEQDELEKILNEILNKILAVPSLLRIQSKRLFLEDFLTNISSKQREINRIAQASIFTTSSLN